MLIVCCVAVNNYRERGADYVNILGRAVSKYLTVPHEFVCFTDDPRGIEFPTRPIPGEGWYAKLYLFREFTEGRVIFFDLDTIILGNIDFLTRFKGDFAILRDFYRKKGYGSGVMAWKGGFGHHITNDYIAEGKPLIEGGDQIYIEQKVKGAKKFQDMYPGKIVSYKADAHAGMPKGSAICCFHGFPKPDDFSYGWVAETWK